MVELYQWIGRILLDEGCVYSLEERALAFEIAACERLADRWLEWRWVEARQVLVNPPLDRMSLYRRLLADGNSLQQAAAFWQLLDQRYRKQAAWIEECAGARESSDAYQVSGYAHFLGQFLQQLEKIDPLAEKLDSQVLRLERQVARLQEEKKRQAIEVGNLRQDLELARQRASQAYRRVEPLREEAQRLSKQLGQARESEEKLRQERRSRIKSERQETEARRDLEQLKREYVKLDRRLKQLVRRLALAEGGCSQPAVPFELTRLHQLEAGEVLGLEGPASAAEIGSMRRQFAALFHPDRVHRLPLWVQSLCQEILGLVNDACDRLERMR